MMSEQNPDRALDRDEGDRTEIDVGALARLITRTIWDYTGGLPGRWVLLLTLQEILSLRDDAATAVAVQVAVDQAWLEEFGGSLRLTHAGRSVT
ncbi:hypothetical protein [Reyranella sp.]|uniref:hypothetical protein n=1 Tax=Reyranella sp. TaxID=1929291 RepID=UPI002730B07B|nr:hypothetical protein [Reyranella sp.]MDP2372366.1 hypothetical protein [Reyranella sp.]